MAWLFVCGFLVQAGSINLLILQTLWSVTWNLSSHVLRCYTLSSFIDIDATVASGQSIYLQICEMCDAVSKLSPAWESMDRLMKFDQVSLVCRSASPWMHIQLITKATEKCSTLFIQKKKRSVSNEWLKATMHPSFFIACISKLVCAHCLFRMLWMDC